MRYTVFDVETPNAKNDRMSAIAAVTVENGRIVDRFYTLVNPETYFNAFNSSLTGIYPKDVVDAPTFPEIWRRLSTAFEGSILVAHNAPFDMSVLSKCLDFYGMRWKPAVRLRISSALPTKSGMLSQSSETTLVRRYPYFSYARDALQTAKARCSVQSR